MQAFAASGLSTENVLAPRPLLVGAGLFVWSMRAKLERMRLRFALLALLVSPVLSVAQDYPYGDEEEFKLEEGDPEDSKNSGEKPVPPPAELPVEKPEDESIDDGLPAPRATQALTPPLVSSSGRRRSLFRMGLKAGANFGFFQDSLCVSADPDGCIDHEKRTFSGPGFDARVSFGWDLAFQPVFLETELAYRRMLINQVEALNVFQVQQGLFYRKRLGARSAWKPGLLTALDVRVVANADGSNDAAVFPALGFASIWEINALIFQLSVYVHELRSNETFVSGSLLTGLRF